MRIVLWVFFFFRGANVVTFLDFFGISGKNFRLRRPNTPEINSSRREASIAGVFDVHKPPGGAHVALEGLQMTSR